MDIKKYVCSFFLIFYCSLLEAQPQLSFEKVQPEKFTSPFIEGMLQDSEGYLWFGSINGLYRFDGFNLKPYLFDRTRNKNPNKGYVYVIYEDGKKNLWVGSNSGLNKLNPRTDEFEPYLPEPGGHVFKNYVWSVTADSRGVLWVGVMGLYYLDQKTNKLKAVKFPEHLQILNNVSFESMCEDKNGILWFGTSIGLFRYNPERNSWKAVFVDPEPGKLSEKNWNTGDYSIPAIYKDKEDILWIGTFGGKILKLNPDTEELTEYNLIYPGVNEPYSVQAICEENSNELWLGTYVGLVLFNKTTGTIKANYRFNENDPSSLSDDQIRSVLKDQSGTLWVGTTVGGLNKVNRTVFPFKRITNKSWMKDKVYNIITYNDFTVSRSGTLLVGTSEGIIEIEHDQTAMIKCEPYKAINVLIEDSKGNQWIGLRQTSGGGILKKDAKDILHSIVDSSGNPLTREVHCFYESSNGHIYVGNEFLLLEIDPEKNSYTVVYQAKARIYVINEDNDGNLLVGTMLGGIILFDPVKKIQLKHFFNVDGDPTTVVDNSITDILRDNKQRIWVSTSLGLCLYDPVKRNFKRFHQQQGTIEAALITMELDNSGKIWLGKINGITCFNPETETFKNYDISYGMHEGHHYSSGKFNGIIYMKARAGVTYFDPDEVVDNPYIPPVRITEMKVFDKSYPVQDEIELAHSENYISFEFAALSFISPEKNLYAYKMEGVDNGWVNSFGRRYAAYTDLKPGKYIFRVKASNNDGVWNNKGTSLIITILPPWWQTYWAFGLYALLVILLLYAWRKYDLKRQTLKFQLQNEQKFASRLQEISEMKSRFFTNISHEFRTPLTLILGPADKVLSEDLHPETQRQVGLMKKNALRLLGLINQLLDISKLDDNKLKLKVSFGNLVAFIKGITMIFESYAESKDITLVIKSHNEEINGYFDKEVLEKVFINIFSNAFKFTPSGGKIYTTISELSDKAIIKVKDTGVGIPEKDLPKLFDRFYQVDNSQTREYEGTGIGLSLTKDLIELHKGKISVQSKLGEWSEFTIEIPLGKYNYNEEQIVTDTPGYNLTERELITDQFNSKLTGPVTVSPSEDIQDKEENGSGKMILLIVEDNADVREYIKGSLHNEFIIEEAANGEQGVRKAQMIIPDLIIGDIMMPKMDGFKMTRILKQDEKTNHIPIILLTAKSDQESKLEGLEAGADDYLIKPFNIRELNIRVNNLINIRRTLQERYSAGDLLPPPVPKIKHPLNTVNEAFMQKVNCLIQKHINKEELTIEEFGNELGMSRTQLHRKLTAITGQSASRYIKSFRLNIAREMIKQQKGNISEIAYSVGFSSPIYFSKCFKDEFGYPPSSLIE